ncbi:hypothetical protein GGR57DRAFT_496724 [Xylariaceae sp. FL1272]|nr:hypothetical protein GGR57DRAFT_496724 [Xylariaceae sp. FL1272]
MSSRSVVAPISGLNGLRAANQLRLFTSTTRRSAPIIHFTPCSTPAIDRTLDDIRNKIILPSYLPEAQQKKLRSPTWEKKLQADPITIEIDGQLKKFRYMNPVKDIPNSRKILLAAVNSFETRADFANFQPLMTGFLHARPFNDDFFCLLIRVMGQKGQIYQIIELARSVKRSSFKLDTPEKAYKVLEFCNLKAHDAGYAEADTRQALLWAEMVIEMLQDDAHQPVREQKGLLLEGELPLKRDPLVMATPLHLAAEIAARYGNDDEILDKVRKHATDMVRLWPEGKKAGEIHPQAVYDTKDTRSENSKTHNFLKAHSDFIAVSAPIQRGLEQAAKLVEPELASKLQARADILAAETQERRGLSKGVRGENMWKKFNGETST